MSVVCKHVAVRLDTAQAIGSGRVILLYGLRHSAACLQSAVAVISRLPKADVLLVAAHRRGAAVVLSLLLGLLFPLGIELGQFLLQPAVGSSQLADAFGVAIDFAVGELELDLLELLFFFDYRFFKLP